MVRKAIHTKEHGATLLQYVLVAALVALAAIASVRVFGKSTRNRFAMNQCMIDVYPFCMAEGIANCAAMVASPAGTANFCNGYFGSGDASPPWLPAGQAGCCSAGTCSNDVCKAGGIYN